MSLSQRPHLIDKARINSSAYVEFKTEPSKPNEFQLMRKKAVSFSIDQVLSRIGVEVEKPKPKKLTKKQYRKMYYQKNKERITEGQKQYITANKEKIAEKKKQYRMKNKEKIIEYKRRYNLIHKERIAEKRRNDYQKIKVTQEQRLKNQKYAKLYYLKHKEKILEKAAVYRKLKKQLMELENAS